MKNLLYEFENTSDEDKKEEILVEVPDAAKAEFKFESGFEYCALIIFTLIDVGVNRISHLVCERFENTIHIC